MRNPFRKYTDDQLASELINRWELHDSFPAGYRKEVLRRNLGGKVLDDFNREQYGKVKSVIERRMGETFEEQKLDMLKSLRKVISLDMAYSHIAEFAYIYNGEDTIGHIPNYYVDRDGNRIALPEEQDVVSIHDKFLVHSPYQTDKWAEAMNRKDNLDPKMFAEDVSSYFPGLNLIIQGNGSVHRMSEAYIDRVRSIAPVRRYFDTPLYENISTNGYRWLNAHTGEELERVTDFRIALIFDIRCREIRAGK